jgi:hypothetical protein
MCPGEATSPHLGFREADIEAMETQRVRVLRQLVSESLYAVDELAVAEAIVVRARTRVLIASQTFRSEEPEVPVRSFRRTRDARSFRLTTGPSRHRHIHH